MWCRNCQQDVPAVRGARFDSLNCSRCDSDLKAQRGFARTKSGNRSSALAASEVAGGDVSGNWPPGELETVSPSSSQNVIEETTREQIQTVDQDVVLTRIDTPAVNDTPEASRPRVEEKTAAHSQPVSNESDVSVSTANSAGERDEAAIRLKPETPVVSDAAIAQFNSEIRRIDKIISVWGESRHLRFDNAHHGPAAEEQTESLPLQEVATAPETKETVEPEEEPSPIAQTNIFAVCLTFGGLLAIVLGAAHAITLSGPRLSHDVRIAAGFVCAGALGVIFGLWFEVGRLRTKVRALSDE